MISAKRLNAVFPGKGKVLRRILENNNSVDAAAEEMDAVLGGFGVEAIWGDSCIRPAAIYINMGETYEPTMLYDYEHHRWDAVSWGDWVEWMENKGYRFH